MSAEQWQQAKAALAEAMALADDARAAYLADLQKNSPELHSEVASLLASQDEAEQAGFLADAETLDQYRTETFDPARTRDYISSDDLPLAPKSKKPQPTDLVSDDYELQDKIGQGGMGVVYKAYHRSLRRTVALKIITGGGLRDEIDIARFHIEAEAAARLDHPGIIPVYDVGEHKGNHYYAMAYVDGPPLSKFVGPTAKKLPPRRVAEIMEQVCRAVQYAHDRAVIHRDLKPANIMLENDEVPRLADFGLAKNMHEEEGLTMTGQVMGTPSYMAPEQARGKLDEISNRTDVYSLGATLYALLAGKPPFAGGTMLETIRQVVRTDPEPLTQILHTIPQDLQTICEKCLAKAPQDRYASADEVADDLRRFLGGFPISARPLGFWARGYRLCQRHPVEASLLALTLAAIVIGSIVSVNFGIQANRALAVAKENEGIANRELERANQNARQLRDAVKDTFIFASEDVLAQEPGMQAARETLLNSAEQYYAELVKQAPDDLESQRDLADAQFMLAKVQMALGNDDKAKRTLEQALVSQRSLAEQLTGDAEIHAAMAKTHNQLAIVAQKSWQSLTQMQAMGKLDDKRTSEVQRQLQSWKGHSAEVIRLRSTVVELQPEDIESKRLLASALMNEGNAMSIRGFTARELIEQDRARAKQLEAQEVRMEVLKSSPDEVLVRRDLGRGFFNMANNELTAADHESQEEAIRSRWQLSTEDLTKAIDSYERLPSAALKLNVRLELARCYRLRADSYFRLMLSAEKSEEDQQAAAEDYRTAEKNLRRLTVRNPSVYRYRIVLAETQHNYCLFNFMIGESESGAEQLARCRETLLQALRVDPSNADAAEQLLSFTQTVVEDLIMNDQPNFDMAERLAQEAVQEIQALQADSEEYAGLKPILEKLVELANKVQELRSETELPSTVT